MPTRVKQYEVYLPLRYNDGQEIELEKFDLTEKELVEKFRGLTTVQRYFPYSKKKLKERFKQEEILITSHELSVI